MDSGRDDCWASAREWWLLLAAGMAALLWGALDSELCILVPGIVLVAVGCLGLGICLAVSNQRSRQ